jgi:hypothetical protein
MKRIVLFFGILLAAASDLSAKCAFLKYTVSGRVMAPDGSSSADVRVYLFLEGATHTSDYPPAVGAAEYVSPDDSGAFEVVSWYNTWTGRERPTGSARGVDDCRRVALRGSLVVIGNGLEARLIPITFGKSATAIRRSGGSASGIEVKLRPLGVGLAASEREDAKSSDQW